MDTDRPRYVEASAPVGMALIAIGVAMGGVHAVAPIYTSWAWAVLVGGLWIVLGALLLFPDVRLYQYEQSPLERLLVERDDQ